MKLSNESFRRAKTFLKTRARQLEKHLFAYYFERGTKEKVLESLSQFQNPDGGFGHALEPDLRTPHSSVLATTHALQMLCQLNVSVEYPMVKKSINYLLHTYDHQKQIWRIIPQSARESPHAPWWNQEKLEENFENFLSNPRAEVIGYLYHYAELVNPEFRQQVLESVLTHFNALSEKISGDSFQCYLQLYEAKNLPQHAKRQLFAKLKCMADYSVEKDPQKWDSYCLKPLGVISTPFSHFYPSMKEAVEQHLDYVIREQGEEGAWSPSWSWGEGHHKVWEKAKQEWQGVLTVKILKNLIDFGRFL